MPDADNSASVDGWPRRVVNLGLWPGQRGDAPVFARYLQGMRDETPVLAMVNRRIGNANAPADYDRESLELFFRVCDLIAIIPWQGPTDTQQHKQMQLHFAVEAANQIPDAMRMCAALVASDHAREWIDLAREINRTGFIYTPDEPPAVHQEPAPTARMDSDQWIDFYRGAYRILN